MESVEITGLHNIVEILRSVYDRTGMYIGRKDDVNGAVCFLQGFFTACEALNLGYGHDIRHQVLSESGWEHRADGIWTQMREKGMTEEAIVKELIRLEIERWQKLVVEKHSSE